MIIRCPQCTTRYQVDPATIRAEGRTVRCSRCGHSWVQMPEPEAAGAASATPVVASRPPADPPAASAPPVPVPAAEPPPAAPPPAAPTPAAERPLSTAGHQPVRSRPVRERRSQGSRAATVLWVLLFLVVFGTAAAAMLLRDDIIRTWPAAAPLYELVGLGEEPPGTGLGLEKIAWKALNRDGGRVLAVEGEIANQSDVARRVPPVYGVLYDKDDRELQRWSIAPPEGRLLPGERVPFRSEMKEPSAAAVRLQITFVPKAEKP